jgi:acetate kinase
MHVQRGPPLAVGHVGLPARQVARLPAIDHAHFQTGAFQYTVQRQPVNAGRFHRYGMHALGEQPVAQRVQLRGNRAEHLRPVAAHRNMHVFAADVHERG